MKIHTQHTHAHQTHTDQRTFFSVILLIYLAIAVRHLKLVLYACGGKTRRTNIWRLLDTQQPHIYLYTNSIAMYAQSCLYQRPRYVVLNGLCVERRRNRKMLSWNPEWPADRSDETWSPIGKVLTEKRGKQKLFVDFQRRCSHVIYPWPFFFSSSHLLCHSFSTPLRIEMCDFRIDRRHRQYMTVAQSSYDKQ